MHQFIVIEASAGSLQHSVNVKGKKPTQTQLLQHCRVTDKGRCAAYRLSAKHAHTDLQPLQPNSHTQLWSAI